MLQQTAKLVIMFLCSIVFNSCTLSHVIQLNKQELDYEKFEHKCGAETGRSSFCKDCLTLGQVPLYVDFKSIAFNPATNKIIFSGFVRDYFTHEPMPAEIIFGTIIYQDSSEVHYKQRTKYKHEINNSFEIETVFNPKEIMIIQGIGYLVTYYDLSVLPVNK